MHIICLQGRSSSGKTTTISMLYNQLLKNGFTIVEGGPVRPGANFSAILKRKGVLLGITSYGDMAEQIRSRLSGFQNANCNLAICACRGTGVTLETVRNFPGCTHEFMAKTVETNQRNFFTANTHDAEGLFNMTG